MLFSLDRLNLSGNITIETPSCVLYDVTISRGIDVDPKQLLSITYRARIIRTMEINPPESIDIPIRRENYSSVALYINSNREIKWTKKSLQDALSHISSLVDSDIPSHDTIKNIRIGNPTPDHIQQYPISVLYRWCISLGAQTNPSMSEEDIRRYCLLLTSSRIELVEGIINLFLKENKTLAKAIIYTEKSGYDSSNIGRVSKDEIDRYMQRYNGRFNSSIPKNKVEAVIMAAIRMKMDISYSEYPIQDYYNLISGGPFMDTNMRRLALMFPHAYNLNHKFNPIFPETVYSMDMLRSICVSEQFNLNIVDIRTGYQELGLLYYTDTFLINPRHNTPLETAIEGTPIDTQENGVVIIYYGSIPNGLISLTLNEIGGMIDEAGDFIFDLRTKITLSKDNIQRLKSLIVKNKIQPRSRASCPKAEAWSTLGRTITRVEAIMSNMEHRLKLFRNYFNNLSESDKVKVLNTYKGLFNIALIMRGWDGNLNNIPITNLPKYNVEHVETRSNVMLAEFNSSCRELGEVALYTLDQPLIIQEGGGYKISTDPLKGITIADRIRIVMQGRRTDNMQSCIRLSSNVLLYSIATYMKAIGIIPPFKIEDVKFAS